MKKKKKKRFCVQGYPVEHRDSGGHSLSMPLERLDSSAFAVKEYCGSDSCVDLTLFGSIDARRRLSAKWQSGTLDLKETQAVPS